jgi:hypothetical protein
MYNRLDQNQRALLIEIGNNPKNFQAEILDSSVSSFSELSYYEDW